MLRIRSTAGRCASAFTTPVFSRLPLSVAFATASGPAAPGRASALAAALRQIESTFGKGAIMKLGSAPKSLDIEVIPTGSLALDAALGIGGLPLGRVVELYGPESSGKTTLALHVIAEAQKLGKQCVFIDAEHALDAQYAKALGVNLDDLFLSQPDTGEQALEIADTLVRSGSVDVLVVDSVAALVPKVEIEGEMGDQHMALQARLMSQALRKLTASLSRSKTLIIFLNQIRSKVGVIFGSPDVTPGGNALKFYASIRMEIRRTGQIKKGEEVVGNTTRVKVAKNKLAPPFRVADFEMTYGTGISQIAEAVDVGVATNVLKKSGAWYAINNQQLLDAVNKVLAGASGKVPPAAEAEPAAASSSDKKKPKKKVNSSAADALTSGDVVVAAPSGSHSVITLGDPFMQGKEKMKAFFEAHPAVFDCAIRVIRTAIRENKMEAAAEKSSDAQKAAAVPHDEFDSEGALTMEGSDEVRSTTLM